MPAVQARHWILTIPHAHFTPYLPRGIKYIRGQLELAESGFLHWQICLVGVSPLRLAALKTIFGDVAHCETTRSDAANDYVWKDDTAVIGTRFELGDRPYQRNNRNDWDAILATAKTGSFASIPSDILIRCYSSLKSIAKDNLVPMPTERTVYVYWGRTGTGKSRRAWDEAGFGAYPKDPCTKFWDGYRPEKLEHGNVVIDEFRGEINISHVLRWFDRYPVIVEAKHGAVVLACLNIWITSNVDPRMWYANKPGIDNETIDALIRRLNITHFHYCLLLSLSPDKSGNGLSFGR